MVCMCYSPTLCLYRFPDSGRKKNKPRLLNNSKTHSAETPKPIPPKNVLVPSLKKKRRSRDPIRNRKICKKKKRVDKENRRCEKTEKEKNVTGYTARGQNFPIPSVTRNIRPVGGFVHFGVRPGIRVKGGGEEKKHVGK